MYQVVRKEVRPSTAVPFFDSSAVINDYIRNLMVAKGVTSDYVLSKDGLTCTYTFKWPDQPSFASFTQDAQVAALVIQNRHDYNLANAILSTVVSVGPV